ncbi:MAG: ribonuclease HII [Paenibacillaceae bacterium]|nr:ribonuclease HII [Paenibacillaceae bacterium]
MVDYEGALRSQGFLRIAGVDEVGRGCLCGDVVAAAVVLHRPIVGLADSKVLRPNARQALYEHIVQHADVGIGCVDAAAVDAINVRQASRLAMLRAVDQLAVRPDALLIDFESIDTDVFQQSIVHGDALCASIAAASIVAKVTRDAQCLLWEADDPGYGIAQHKGYATALHRARLRVLGPSPIHRWYVLC